jgi:hypothetical protein
MDDDAGRPLPLIESIESDLACALFLLIADGGKEMFGWVGLPFLPKRSYPSHLVVLWLDQENITR